MLIYDIEYDISHFCDRGFTSPWYPYNYVDDYHNEDSYDDDSDDDDDRHDYNDGGKYYH